jgi:hypothetical protein
MSYPEIDFVLEAIADHYTTALANIEGELATNYTDLDQVAYERVDRTNSRNLTKGTRTKSTELRRANAISAAIQTMSNEPVGTEYDNRVEAVVGLRIEGLHYRDGGFIDPDGEDGIPWFIFVQSVERAILTDRTYPDIGRPFTVFGDVRLQNVTDEAANYKDHYRRDADVVFALGYDDLP